MIAFACLSAGVAANLFAMQDKRRQSPIETSAISKNYRAAQDQTAGGDGAAASAGYSAETAELQKPAPQAGRNSGLVSKAEIVRGVQRELQTRGYGTGQPDGVAGLMTRASIMAYEYDYGLNLTAEPTEELLSRIVLGTAGPVADLKTAPAVKGTEAEAVIRVVKQMLAGLGYAPGKADVKLTEETVRAIRDFELDQKLPETGRISGQLVSRLMRLQGQSQAQAKQPGAQK